MKKLAIVTTHPIQYNAPLFQALTGRRNIDIHVFYTWGEKVLENKFDPGFGKIVKWDIPLQEGYSHSFVRNIATKPGSHHYSGINNPTLIEEVEQWGADAILVFGWNFKSHLKCIRHFYKKVPILFRGDSTLLDTISPAKSIIKSAILRWIYKHVDVALYTGSANRDYFLQYGMKLEKLRFAPHAIDNNRFNAGITTIREQASEWRKSLGINGNDIVFLFAGKLEPKKSPGLLLDAFLQLKHPGAHLVIVGNGILEHTLKLAAGNSEKIHFLSFQNQTRMPLVYNLADVFVLPSGGPGESWGLSVNEAMSCKKAVLVSDRCGCAQDLVKPGLNGEVFRANNEYDLVGKIKSFLVSKEKLEKMGEASFEIIEQWSFEQVAIALENTILERNIR